MISRCAITPQLPWWILRLWSEFKHFVDIKIQADCGAFLEAFSVPQTRCEEHIQEWLQECRSLVEEFPRIEEAHVDDIFLTRAE